MKLLGLVVLVALFFLISFQVYSFWGERTAINQKFDKSKAELNQAKIDQAKLQSELEYLSNPVNLEKEFRARFNLRRPDEKLIIVVPQNPTSSASTTEKSQ